RRPHPAEGPPVPVAPRVVPLADAVEGDRLVAHEDLAVHGAGALVAGGARPGVDGAVGLPLEVEAEWHPLAPEVAVHLGGVVDADGERLAAEGEVLEGGLDRVVSPEALGPDLERRRRRRPDLV